MYRSRYRSRYRYRLDIDTQFGTVQLSMALWLLCPVSPSHSHSCALLPELLPQSTTQSTAFKKLLFICFKYPSPGSPH